MDQHIDLVHASRRLSEALTPDDLDNTPVRITAAAVEVLPDVDYASTAWTRSTTFPVWSRQRSPPGSCFVAALVLVPVPVVLVRSVQRHGVRLDATWALLAIHALVTLQSVVAFLATGGGFHDRYLMQVMPVLATATALGMLEVGRWRTRACLDAAAADRRDWWAAAGWSGLLLVWLAGTLAWLEHHYVFSRQDGSPVDGLLPDALVVLAIGTGAALLAVMIAQPRAARHPAVTTRQLEDDQISI